MPDSAPKIKRRIGRYGLRTLFVVMAVASLLFVHFAPSLRENRIDSIEHWIRVSGGAEWLPLDRRCPQCERTTPQRYLWNSSQDTVAGREYLCSRCGLLYWTETTPGISGRGNRKSEVPNAGDQ